MITIPKCIESSQLLIEKATLQSRISLIDQRQRELDAAMPVSALARSNIAYATLLAMPRCALFGL